MFEVAPLEPRSMLDGIKHKTFDSKLTCCPTAGMISLRGEISIDLEIGR
jgi:hypothetical protein